MQTAVPLKALLLSLVVACLLAATLAARPAPAFIDVPIDHWAYGDVTMLVELGLVGGYEDGTYRPDDVVNRGQMAVYIGRTLRSSLVSVKTGWVESIDPLTDRVHVLKEPRATEYRLYVSNDCGGTWALSLGPPVVESFFDVYWTVARPEMHGAYRPVAVVATKEVDLCGVLYTIGGPPNDWPLSVVAQRNPVVDWFCDASQLGDPHCVAFYVLRVELVVDQAVVGTVYEAILDRSVRVLQYGRLVGWPGVLAAKVDPLYATLPCGNTYRFTVWGVGWGGWAFYRFTAADLVLAP